jgi:uncharacterized protein (TIGR00730 family)
MNRVCVFCGSNKGKDPAYAAAAQAMGRALAERGLALVYGGGGVGLMGLLADATLAAGGEVIGVIPEALFAKEVGHRNLTDLRVVRSMHERKALMANLADAFIALPGGMGTFEELCEMITWAQLGIHRKPCAILNVNNFYGHLLQMFDYATAEDFIRPDHRQLVLSEEDPYLLLDRLAEYHAPTIPKWLKRSET